MKSFIKALTSIFLGLIFTFIVFEIALFAFGKLERVARKLQNNSSRNNEFVILALGESTTVPMHNLKMQDYSWPAYLEKILKKENLNKRIKVINEGKESVNSDRIISDLEKNIKEYNPDLVISMMGINDFFGGIVYETEAGIKANSPLSKSRVYKLIKFLIANIKEKNELKAKEKLDCDGERACLDLAFQQKYGGYFETELAIKFLNKALEYNPNSTEAMIELGFRYMYIYTEDKNRKEQNEETIIQSIEYFEKAMKLDPTSSFANTGLINALEQSINLTSDDILLKTTKVKENIEKHKINSTDLFLALAICARCHGEEQPGFFKNKNQIFYLEKALEIEPNHTLSLLNLARYHIQYSEFDEAEKFYLKVLKQNMKDQIHGSALVELANLYLGTNREELANEIFKKAMNINGMYASNYQKLYQTLNDKNIQLIAAQYPMRSTEPLELLFKDSEDVLIVDNELLFKDLVREEGYDSIFVDRFAGDFGHCSERGNLLLAENIASVILENWEEINVEN
jgi:tetratricopeptide (TPR) repeat protein